MDSQKKLTLAIIFSSIFLGAVIIPNLVNLNRSIGLFIGGIISIILIKLTYPEIFNETEEQARIERRAMKQQSFLDLYFFHPIRAPLTFSMVIFILTITLVLILDELNLQQVVSEVLNLGLMSCAFLWGLSGFLTLTRNQFIDNRGPNIIKYKGFWAFLNGILFVAVGWGGIIISALSSIFDW